jgi:hypothetical protein
MTVPLLFASLRASPVLCELCVMEFVRRKDRKGRKARKDAKAYFSH